jgi:hypothetical protein
MMCIVDVNELISLLHGSKDHNEWYDYMAALSLTLTWSYHKPMITNELKHQWYDLLERYIAVSPSSYDDHVLFRRTLAAMALAFSSFTKPHWQRLMDRLLPLLTRHNPYSNTNHNNGHSHDIDAANNIDREQNDGINALLRASIFQLFCQMSQHESASSILLGNGALLMVISEQLAWCAEFSTSDISYHHYYAHQWAMRLLFQLSSLANFARPLATLITRILPSLMVWLHRPRQPNSYYDNGNVGVAMECIASLSLIYMNRYHHGTMNRSLSSSISTRHGISQQWYIGGNMDWLLRLCLHHNATIRTCAYTCLSRLLTSSSSSLSSLAELINANVDIFTTSLRSLLNHHQCYAVRSSSAQVLANAISCLYTLRQQSNDSKRLNDNSNTNEESLLHDHIWLQQLITSIPDLMPHPLIATSMLSNGIWYIRIMSLIKNTLLLLPSHVEPILCRVDLFHWLLDLLAACSLYTHLAATTQNTRINNDSNDDHATAVMLACQIVDILLTLLSLPSRSLTLPHHLLKRSDCIHSLLSLLLPINTHVNRTTVNTSAPSSSKSSSLPLPLRVISILEREFGAKWWTTNDDNNNDSSTDNSNGDISINLSSMVSGTPHKLASAGGGGSISKTSTTMVPPMLLSRVVQLLDAICRVAPAATTVLLQNYFNRPNTASLSFSSSSRSSSFAPADLTLCLSNAIVKHSEHVITTATFDQHSNALLHGICQLIIAMTLSAKQHHNGEPETEVEDTEKNSKHDEDIDDNDAINEAETHLCQSLTRHIRLVTAALNTGVAIAAASSSPSPSSSSSSCSITIQHVNQWYESKTWAMNALSSLLTVSPSACYAAVISPQPPSAGPTSSTTAPTSKQPRQPLLCEWLVSQIEELLVRVTRYRPQISSTSSQRAKNKHRLGGNDSTNDKPSSDTPIGIENGLDDIAAQLSQLLYMCRCVLSHSTTTSTATIATKSGTIKNTMMSMGLITTLERVIRLCGEASWINAHIVWCRVLDQLLALIALLCKGTPAAKLAMASSVSASNVATIVTSTTSTVVSSSSSIAPSSLSSSGGILWWLTRLSRYSSSLPLHILRSLYGCLQSISLHPHAASLIAKVLQRLS